MDSSLLKGKYELFSELARYIKYIFKKYIMLEIKRVQGILFNLETTELLDATRYPTFYSSRLSYPGFGLFVEVFLYKQAAYG